MSPSSTDRTGGLGRRDVLRTTGFVLAGGVLATGSATAHGDGGGAPGGSVSLGGGTVSTYTERAHGKLSAVGVEFDAAVLSGLPTTPSANNLALPRGDTGRFEYVGVDWNPQGHPPLFMSGHPHFDFHFYMLEQEDVAAIPPGVATYDIPDALMPAGTSTAAALNFPREVVPGMGEHLISVPGSLPFGNPTWSPVNPAPDGWSVYIWGAYDPDGDGTGQLTFMEPMITVVYLNDLRGDGTADTGDSLSIPMPERFLKGGWYPTEMVTRYHSHDDTFTVSLESFERFSGYGRR